MTPTVTATKIPVACMAPPLTDELLAEYRGLIDAVPAGELRDALDACYACAEAWWDVPESAAAPVRTWNLVDAAGKVRSCPERPLTADLVKRLWDATPYMSELERLSPTTPPELLDTGLFDRLPSGVKELVVVREPVESARGGDFTAEEAAAKVGANPHAKLKTVVVDAKAKRLRDAAFHLLWHCKEITTDREPMTADKLTG